MENSTLNTHFKTLRPLLRPAGAFWSWWIAELGGMLPKGVRSTIVPKADRLYLQPLGPALIVSRSIGEAVEQIGSFPLAEHDRDTETTRELAGLSARSREVVLCLPADKVLRKPVTLPLAAEENLYEVLGFEMDRHTPFTADQVYYDFSITARNAKANTLTLELAVTPRTYLDGLLSTLADRGVWPHRAAIREDNDGRLLAFELLPSQNRPSKTGSARHLNLALGMLALLLSLGAIALPLANKLHVIRTLESRVDVAAGKAEVTRRLDDEVRRLEADLRFLTEKKLAAPLMLSILNELTHILPDDTWISRLTINSGEIQLQGQSAAAAALIPLIAASDVLENPRFRSPVTRAPQSTFESFNLSADVAGAPADD